MLLLLLPALAILVLPFLVFCLSTAWFHRNVHGRSLPTTPPTIPYFLPLVFHAFHLAYEGPTRHFGALLRQYGRSKPLVVRAAFKSFVVIRHAKHLDVVMHTQKPVDLIAAHNHMARALFGSKADGKDENANEAMLYMHCTLPQKQLAGAPLLSIVGAYASILSSDLNGKMFQVDTWTQIDDFLSFFHQVVVRCNIETLFGSAILNQCPGIVKAYGKLADAIDGFMLDLPAYALSSAYKGPRDWLLEGIEKWLKASDEGGRSEQLAGQDALRDPVKGSRFIQERDCAFAKEENVDLRARAVEMLSVMLESNSAFSSPAFWAIVETLRKPDVHARLVADIRPFCSAQTTEYDMASIGKIPLAESLVAETLRLRTATVAARKNRVNGFRLDEQWTLPKGIVMTLFSRDFSMNADMWASIRPRAVEKPLEAFWAERFLTENGGFSLDGLEMWRALFDRLLGREYAHAMQMATLTVFLTQFELQLCDTDAIDAAMPSVGEVAHGEVKPLESIAVRIRKRR